jgi:hypothetical protein
MRVPSKFILGALALCHVASAGAQVVGSGQLKGPFSFAVKGCGGDRGPIEVGMQVRPDGTWTAGSGEGITFAGTSQPVGANGRKIALAFDAPTEQGFVAQRVLDIEALCRRPGFVTESVTPQQLTLALNAKRTRATLVVVYRLAGNLAGKARKATFRLRSAGRWSAA